MTRLVIAVTLGLLVAAHGPGQDKAKSDKDMLQGSWQGVSIEWKGKPLPDAEAVLWVIEGDTLTVKQGDNLMAKGKLKLDSARKPKTLDLEHVEEVGSVKKGQVQQAIYTIDGDTLKLCIGAPGVEDRPKEFSTTDKQNHVLIVARRSKK